MLIHRLFGAVLACLGLALLFGQFLMFYGSTAQERLMVDIGLPGVAMLSAFGAISFSIGCLLAAAPQTTVRHVSRAVSLARGRPS